MHHRRAGFAEGADGPVWIGDLEGDVVDAFAVLVEKFLPGRVTADRLDQF
jgi:hypothetical protein